ncbi:RxLR-like protein [Plasmopara halstedii]|uniref:RxLR-like protein n=1 Tax=Plasmopara halstedii TaxID=4781 RepID=A0A0N7L5B5_PLAHL|nr:RxLR-like protein [Plasmopara halstedii]CEG41011.1 RxLR-like protein [Plasmopara halstedii]|eukprot:XP_024577380.1 RxLR-like protein [Plasmopara halstedii]
MNNVLLATLVFLASLLVSTTSSVIDLSPEIAIKSQRVLYGLPQLFRVSALLPDTIYDIKVSYPATQPTLFRLQVEQVVLSPPARSDEAYDSETFVSNNKDTGEPLRQRRLNTATLRLHPTALRTHESVRYRLESYDDTTEVTFSLLAEVEGIQRPGSKLDMSECVFDIVVEEMLLGAFPRHTLVLIGWLMFLLYVSGKWVLPYLEKKIALEFEKDRVEVKKS